MEFIKESFINATPEKVFAFHELPDAFEKLMPPWEKAKIIQKADISKIGSQAIIEMKVLGLVSTKWIAEHTKYEPPKMFEDVQISGPFKSWRHTHLIIPHQSGTILQDKIEFEPPLWFLGEIAAPLVIIPKLKKLFEYRHKITKQWCEQD